MLKAQTTHMQELLLMNLHKDFCGSLLLGCTVLLHQQKSIIT